MARTVARLFWFAWGLGAIALTAGMLSPWFCDRFWICEVATHFQTQYVVLMAIVALVFALDAKFKWAVYSFFVATVGFCHYLLPLYTGGPPANGEPRNLRLVSSNIAFFNPTKDALISFLKNEQPDVVLLYEVSDEWLDTLRGLEADFPHYAVYPHEFHSGIAIFSRLPLEQTQRRTIGATESPIVETTVIVGETSMKLIGVHPDPPMSLRAALNRNDQLQNLAELIVMEPAPLVVAGDFNTSSFHPAFRRLVNDTGLRDSRRGFGVQATWSTMLPLLRTAIDHCLVSPRVQVIDRRVGPYIGSDHFPIIVDLRVR